MSQKVVIVGNSRVGKSCLLDRICGLDFTEQKDPTVCDDREVPLRNNNDDLEDANSLKISGIHTMKRENRYEIFNTRRVLSMIQSVRPTVPPVAITFFTWKLFVFPRYWKWTYKPKYGQTTCVKIVITTGRNCRSASWIFRSDILRCYQTFCLVKCSRDVSIFKITNQESLRRITEWIIDDSCLAFYYFLRSCVQWHLRWRGLWSPATSVLLGLESHPHMLCHGLGRVIPRSLQALDAWNQTLLTNNPQNPCRNKIRWSKWR